MIPTVNIKISLLESKKDFNEYVHNVLILYKISDLRMSIYSKNALDVCKIRNFCKPYLWKYFISILRHAHMGWLIGNIYTDQWRSMLRPMKILWRSSKIIHL